MNKSYIRLASVSSTCTLCISRLQSLVVSITYQCRIRFCGTLTTVYESVFQRLETPCTIYPGGCIPMQTSSCIPKHVFLALGLDSTVWHNPHLWSRPRLFSYIEHISCDSLIDLMEDINKIMSTKTNNEYKVVCSPPL